MHAYAFAAYVFTFVLSFALLLRLELDASEVWRSLPTSAVITRLSAAMDGQPRHQHRPPSTASNRTSARRPPTPFEAHRALRQRRLKASSHIYIHENTVALTTLPSSFDSQGWHFRDAPEEAVQFAERSYRAGVKCGVDFDSQGWHLRDARNTTVLAQRPTAKREVWVRNHIGEFKGCQWHSSKGGS